MYKPIAGTKAVKRYGQISFKIVFISLFVFANFGFLMKKGRTTGAPSNRPSTNHSTANLNGYLFARSFCNSQKPAVVSTFAATSLPKDTYHLSLSACRTSRSKCR